MHLHDYLSQPHAPTIPELRARLQAAGYDVKSDAQIRQWRYRYEGRVPSPENCTGLELVSDGAITRQEMRPDDWHRIWPELRDAVTKCSGSGAKPTEPAGEAA